MVAWPFAPESLQMLVGVGTSTHSPAIRPGQGPTDHAPSEAAFNRPHGKLRPVIQEATCSGALPLDTARRGAAVRRALSYARRRLSCMHDKRVGRVDAAGAATVNRSGADS